jgi:hypothetical protein
MARWMYACGFCFKQKEGETLPRRWPQMSEGPETFAYRPVFSQKYLGYEIWAHCWLHITLEESNTLISEGYLAANCGFNNKQLTVQKRWSITWTPHTPSMRDWVHCLLVGALASYRSQSIPNQLCLWDKMKQSSTVSTLS